MSKLDMTKPFFSFALIAKNEAKTLPRLVKSLEEFQSRGGEIIVVDTGSTDGTPEVARLLGCKVYEEGERFITTLDQSLADEINGRFVVEGEQPVVSGGSRLFDYSAARNYAASLTSKDIVAMPDCDEVWTKLDIDAINRHIQDGVGRFEYNFVFSHDQFGNEAVKFLHSKFYDRTKIRWTGIVHEVLTGDARGQFLPEDQVKLEHWQNPETNRGGYLPGLAVDCFIHPNNDRNSHYFARELMWHGRPKSAIKEFRRHIDMNAWPAERAQSMIFVGDCTLQLGQDRESEALDWYFRAFALDPRREALLRLAGFYWRKNDPKHAAAFANACLTIPWDGFYSNNLSHYTHEPHEILYWALWYLGDREGSKQHWEKAYFHAPQHPKFRHDSRFYYPYPDNGIEGWMSCKELNWLLDTSKRMKTVAELGSWKGRSTHALCTGTNGSVVAIDHFRGSDSDGQNEAARKKALAAHAEALENPDAIYQQFMANMANFKNLTVNRKATVDAVNDYADESFDMVFIDASHNYNDVRRDIRLWKPKAKFMLCGHDYSERWPDVMRAVNDELGKVQVCDTIWYVDLRKNVGSPRTLTLKVMGALIEDNIPFVFVKRGDGEKACMAGQTGHNCDGHPYTPELADKLRQSFSFLEPIATVVEFEDQKNYNVLLHRTDSDTSRRRDFYKLIRTSPRRKVFVGPRKLSAVSLLLLAEFVEVPKVNAFSSYEEVLAKLKKKADNGTIFLFSASLPAKCWIADVVQHNPNVTCLDTGSAFDPLFIGQTRTDQADQRHLQGLYAEMMWCPKISVVIPTLGRPQKLENLLKLISENADYPNYEVIVKQDDWPPNNTGVPKLVQKAVWESSGELVMYLGNDCVPHPGFMRAAYIDMAIHFPELNGLVGLNDGYWVAGEFATHWLGSKKLLPMLDGEFFHTGYYHCGCDNELTERCRKEGLYFWSKESFVFHDHPIQKGFKADSMDKVYELAYDVSRQEHDKNLLTERSKLLGFPPPKVYTYPDQVD